MTQNKLIAVLFCVCIFFALVFVLSFVPWGKSASGEIESALLNPKYAEQVAYCTLSFANETLELSRIDGIWLGSANQIVFPVEAKTMESFLEAVSKIRTLRIVSKNPTDDTLKNFGLDQNQVFKVQLMKEDRTICSSLYFGGNNYSGQGIYLFSDTNGNTTKNSNLTIYETQNDLFPWLTTASKQWADMNIVPQSLMGSVTEDKIQRLIVDSPEKSLLLFPKDKNFAEKVLRLLSLRGGDILPLKVLTDAKKTATITLETGTGGEAKLFVYQKNTGDELTYYLVPKITPAIENKNATLAVNRCSYALEISRWTYNRLWE